MEQTRRPTLADVAHAAGVSVTTASYVVNGRDLQMRISPDAAQRVRRAVDELAYRPNRSARNLRTSTTATIGVISVDVASGDYASQMLTGAAAEARALEHLLLIGESEGDVEVEEGLVEEMLDRQVDGIVYATLSHTEVHLPRALVDRRVVLLNCVDPDNPALTIVPDEEQGGRTAARALAEAVPTGPILVVGEDPTPNSLAGRLRVRGITAELDHVNRRVEDQVACAWEVGPAWEAVTAHLRSGRPMGGLICLNDRIGMGAYQALTDHGLRVPDDVSVVSFDGSPLASWLRPALASVAIPFAVLGARAVRLLLRPESHLDGHVRVPMPLVPGASLAPAPS